MSMSDLSPTSDGRWRGCVCGAVSFGPLPLSETSWVGQHIFSVCTSLLPQPQSVISELRGIRGRKLWAVLALRTCCWFSFL